jgi:hypothetical protein
MIRENKRKLIFLILLNEMFEEPGHLNYLKSEEDPVRAKRNPLTFLQKAAAVLSLSSYNPFRGLPVYILPENVADLPSDEVRRLYRFTWPEIVKVFVELRLPEVIYTKNRLVESGIRALMMVMRKFAFPIRLQCLAKAFGREYSQISRIISVTTDIIFKRWAPIMLFDVRRLSSETLQRYGSAFKDAGLPYENLWGFIDGTIRKICRPSKNQRIYYSGHKRCHCLRYQNVTTPDGLISSFYGPLPGSNNDLNILDDSGLSDIMRRHCPDFHLYGDAAYASRGPQFITAFIPPSNEIERTINTVMNSYRTEVEHSFAVVNNSFAYSDLRSSQKIYLTSVIKDYPVCILFCNIMNTFRPNQVSQRFKMAPPSIQEYLNP